MIDPRAAYCFEDFLTTQDTYLEEAKTFLEKYFDISTESSSVEYLTWNDPMPVEGHRDFVSIIFLDNYELGGTITTKLEKIVPKKGTLSLINVKRLLSEHTNLEKGPGKYILIFWKNTRENN